VIVDTYCGIIGQQACMQKLQGDYIKIGTYTNCIFQFQPRSYIYTYCVPDVDSKCRTKLKYKNACIYIGTLVLMNVNKHLNMKIPSINQLSISEKKDYAL